MLGTLVVQLPCAGGHQGGRLMVRHKGEDFQHDFAQVRRGEEGGGLGWVVGWVCMVGRLWQGRSVCVWGGGGSHGWGNDEEGDG